MKVLEFFGMRSLKEAAVAISLVIFGAAAVLSVIK
jgi:hypothetical protein